MAHAHWSRFSIVTGGQSYCVFQQLAAGGDYQYNVRELKDYALQQPQRPVIGAQRLVCS